MNIASFLEDVQFNSNKPALTLLLDTDFSKEIRIVFKKGQTMEDHQAPFAIIVHIVEGIIDFGVNKEVKRLTAGHILSLKPHEVHNLTAIENSIVRLTLSKTDSVKRVKEVL
ncbi:AraC family ligand binding domain-containing protein [Polaribacter batillariae]|uniref:AraC family ligand binding domain-containing protein n=1 Tax=Polaribacter batillariae TaxID=2808900 RepID=A0ABX7SU96_9FLAO|nr:AraC family ligand binding domain-containing protein [Polaribacter batillariae]QTD36930.1 AraC family ligand binding domain-containing protein [Polaribacter batillariae]